MSSSNNLMVVNRPRRFERIGTTQLARPAPASPMVLKMLMQSILQLNQKVDAIAVRRSQPLEVRAEESAPIKARQVEINPPARTIRQKVDRKGLLDIFD